MHPIRKIKEKLGSAVEEIAVTAPQIVKDATVAVGDKAKEFNEKVLEPEEQKFADERGYTHGGKREKIVKHLSGIHKCESGAHFIDEHVVNPMRPNYDKDKSSSSTTT